MPHQLTLHHYWRSSCSWRVRWALALKGVTPKSVPVNLLKGEQNAPEYQAKNPTGFVPCLEIDGQPYGESLALIEWIDETWKDPPLLPKDPLQRLKARQLASLIVSGIQPLQNPMVLKQSVVGTDKASDEERQKLGRFFIERGLANYEKLLAGSAGQFSVGDQVTVADLCLVPQIYNAQRFGVPVEKYKKAFEIFERCLKTPACDKAAPHNQEGAQP